MAKTKNEELSFRYAYMHERKPWDRKPCSEVFKSKKDYDRKERKKADRKRIAEES